MGHLSGEIGFVATSLAYGMGLPLSFIDHLGDTRSDHPADVLAFSVIVYLVVRSNADKVPIPSLLRTIVKDATYYFLIIFTSHFVLVMFLAFASVSTSPQSSIFSLRFTYTFIGFDEATPCFVSDTWTLPIHPLTIFFSAQQWNACVCPDISFPSKTSRLSRVLGLFH